MRFLRRGAVHCVHCHAKLKLPAAHWRTLFYCDHGEEQSQQLIFDWLVVFACVMAPQVHIETEAGQEL